MSLSKEAITLTFGDCAENHVGMQQLGTKHARGYSSADLTEISEKLKDEDMYFEWYDLSKLSFLPEFQNKGIELPEAALLVVRGYLDAEVAQNLFDQLKSLPWDRQALMRGKVVNKHARYNLCFDCFDQEADFANGRGTVVNIASNALLSSLSDRVNSLTGFENKVEGNYYYDLDRCGIGYHGDAERSKTLGIRLGGSFPLVFRWYQRSQPISNRFQIMLNAGDMYIMSEKAAGSDWMKKVVPTLRHAAGCDKFIG